MNSEITAVIAEDIESYLHTIEKLVTEVAPKVRITGKSTSLAEASKLITSLHPDVVLLDIQFEMEGKTAFDLLDELSLAGKLNFQIIFITAHQESKYYSQAFKFNAIHFIEKPIDKLKLMEAFDRVNSLLGTDIKSMFAHFQEIHDHWHTPKMLQKIVVEGNNFVEIIAINEIAIIEASGRYTNVYLTNGRSLVSCRNLGEYDKMLKQFLKFFRIHNNKIINVELIKRYSKKERIIEMISPLGKHIASKEKFKEFIRLTENHFEI